MDICAASVTRAKQNCQLENLENRLHFKCEDAVQFRSEKAFSHIIVGAALGFFPNPKLMIANMEKLFSDNGYLLASPFYVTKKVPDRLISEAKKIFGMTPTVKSRKQIMQLYRGFDVLFEDRLEPEPETEGELKHYCQSTIERVCQEKGITRDALYNVMYKRLYEIREMSNYLREYQEYSVLVLRYDRNTYPKRFVELF